MSCPTPYSSIACIKQQYSLRKNYKYVLPLFYHLRMQQSKVLCGLTSYLAGFKKSNFSNFSTISDTIFGPAVKEFLFVDPLEIQIILARAQMKDQSDQDELINMLLVDFEIQDGRFKERKGQSVIQERKQMQVAQLIQSMISNIKENEKSGHFY